MSQVKMPEPRWYAAMHGQALYGVYDTPEGAFDAASDTPGLMTIDRLITTTQAEAYADAKVREALEGVIQRLDAEIAVAREHKAYAAGLAFMRQAELIRASLGKPIPGPATNTKE